MAKEESAHGGDGNEGFMAYILWELGKKMVDQHQNWSWIV